MANGCRGRRGCLTPIATISLKRAAKAPLQTSGSPQPGGSAQSQGQRAGAGGLVPTHPPRHRRPPRSARAPCRVPSPPRCGRTRRRCRSPRAPRSRARTPQVPLWGLPHCQEEPGPQLGPLASQPWRPRGTSSPAQLRRARRARARARLPAQESPPLPGLPCDSKLALGQRHTPGEGAERRRAASDPASIRGRARTSPGPAPPPRGAPMMTRCRADDDVLAQPREPATPTPCSALAA